MTNFRQIGLIFACIQGRWAEKIIESPQHSIPAIRATPRECRPRNKLLIILIGGIVICKQARLPCSRLRLCLLKIQRKEALQ